MLKENIRSRKTRNYNVAQDQDVDLLENLDATNLSVSKISLLHEFLGSVIDRLRKHDPKVIQELRKKGYNTESEPKSEQQPISRNRSQI